MEDIVILTSTERRIEGFWNTAYKGIVQGQTWNEFLRRAEEIRANAVLNTHFDGTLEMDTLFHGFAVVLERINSPPLRTPKDRKLPQPARRNR